MFLSFLFVYVDYIKVNTDWQGEMTWIAALSKSWVLSPCTTDRKISGKTKK
jgi:hypothetical protein